MYRPIIINLKNEDIIEYIKEHAGIYENKETKEQIQAIYMDTLAVMHIDYKSQIIAKFPIRYPENDPVVAVKAFHYLTPTGQVLSPEEIQQNYRHVDKMEPWLNLFNIKTYRVSDQESLSLQVKNNYQEHDVIEKLKQQHSVYIKLTNDDDKNIVVFKINQEYLLVYPTVEEKNNNPRANFYSGTTLVRCHNQKNLFKVINGSEMKLMFDFFKKDKDSIIEKCSDIQLLNEKMMPTHTEVIKNIKMIKEKNMSGSTIKKMNR